MKVMMATSICVLGHTSPIDDEFRKTEGGVVVRPPVLNPANHQRRWAVVDEKNQSRRRRNQRASDSCGVFLFFDG